MARVSCASLPGRPPVLLLLYTTTYACVRVLCVFMYFFFLFCDSSVYVTGDIYKYIYIFTVRRRCSALV